MDDSLIWIRALHFAATLSASGAVLFRFLVAGPALRVADEKSRAASIICSRLAVITWVSLALVAATGAAWLAVQTERMSELPLAAAISQGAFWTFLTATDFGNVWLARLGLTVLLAGALLIEAGRLARHARGILPVVFAAGLVGALAFAGHGGAEEGVIGTVHLGADILHLIAAAAWVGALLPLAVVLGVARSEHASLALASATTVRFSNLGVASVGTILASGIVNTWVLAGSVEALTATEYGRLLLIKIALFFVMLAIAAFNRLRLTPLIAGGIGADDALRQLRANCLIEASFGAIILFIVGWLGTLPPGLNAAAQ